MRSCGGAIQGIRELPLSFFFPGEEDNNNTSDQQRAYHNRADGGFVYADDGSYSAGPEQWDWNVSDESDEDETVSPNAKQLLMASLAFPDRRRAWLITDLSEASVAAVKCIAEEEENHNIMHQLTPKVLELSRPVSTTDDIISSNDDDALEEESMQLPTVHWKEIQRVRMPNPTMPWSLARAKWEKQVIAEAEEEGRGRRCKRRRQQREYRNAEWLGICLFWRPRYHIIWGCSW